MRCAQCKTKLAAVTFGCACEKTFCVKCRLPEVHSCPAQVKKEVILPKVIASKLETI
jgi:hypothetical protein